MFHRRTLVKLMVEGQPSTKNALYLTKPNHMSVVYYSKNKSISNVLIVVGHSKPTTARGIGRTPIKN